MSFISNVIWIDPYYDYSEKKNYIEELDSFWYLKIACFKTVKEAINYIKCIDFVETKIIIDEKMYIKFIKSFIENLKDIYIIPKIFIFTKQKELFIQNNKKYLNFINHSFYNFGGIKTSFDEIKKCLINPKKKKKQLNKNEENIQMTFEYIDKKEQLVLPLLYKTIIDRESLDNLDNYTNSIYEKYSKENNDINNVLEEIKSIKNLPIDLLAKYYIRAYTIHSNFYKDIDEDLGFNHKENHLPFIKTLYESIKLKAIPLSSNNTLYRGSKISNNEIEKIKSYLKNKKKDLPAAIVFSKSFLSFSKDEKSAKSFLKKKNENNKLSKVFYILEKDNNIDYCLSTHADIEKISYYNEREVLFFPFSSFEIKEIEESNYKGEKIYKIKLLYLGKFLKEIEKAKIINIPDSEFKKQIIDFGLIKPEKSNNVKILFDNYKIYKDEINKNNKFNDYKKSNFIIADFIINEKDINKDIQIINSYDNENKNDNDFQEIDCNEKEIIENIDIFINDKKIDFSYHHKFNEKGKYVISYFFKKNLNKTNYMFYGCKYLTNIDLSNFNTKNVTNMGDMFNGCELLTNINLSNFNTQNVTTMKSMFYGCTSLTNINLSNFNLQKRYISFVQYPLIKYN